MWHVPLEEEDWSFADGYQVPWSYIREAPVSDSRWLGLWLYLGVKLHSGCIGQDLLSVPLNSRFRWLRACLDRFKFFLHHPYAARSLLRRPTHLHTAQSVCLEP
jgi:hypothetical protein